MMEPNTVKEWVIVRSYGAGVFEGLLASKEDRTVVLEQPPAVTIADFGIGNAGLFEQPTQTPLYYQPEPWAMSTWWAKPAATKP